MEIRRAVEILNKCPDTSNRTWVEIELSNEKTSIGYQVTETSITKLSPNELVGMILHRTTRQEAKCGMGLKDVLCVLYELHCKGIDW